MGVIGSLLGATVGWWTAGPLGAIVGLIIGYVAEESNTTLSSMKDADSSRQAKGGFVASLLVLMAAVMRSDGKVVHSELDFVKSYLSRTLGPQQASEALLILRDILKREIPVREICHQIRVNLDYASRLELIHLLFQIARADRQIAKSEMTIIESIAADLGISSGDFISIRSMYYSDLESAYKILEVEATTTDDEVKKAYKKLAVRFHPDKVEHLGDEFKKSANEKFKHLNEAYQRIRNARGMK
jgi:DnaJ like chaperone protein